MSARHGDVVKRIARIVVGFAVCPVLPLLVREAISPPVTLVHYPPEIYVELFCFVYVIAFFFGVGLGLPVFLILVWRRWVGRTSFALVGFAIGALLSYIVPTATGSALFDLLATGAASAISGLLLFLIAYGIRAPSENVVVS